MIATRLIPLALVLGSLTPIQAQYKVTYNFGAPGEPSCPGYAGTGMISQTPGGNLISSANGGCEGFTNGAAFEVGFQGANFTILQEFGTTIPSGGLTLGTDQRFHGVTTFGGSRNHGTVYRLSTQPDIVYEHDFEGGADGGYPWFQPIQGADGSFYGTTAGASSAYAGTVYKIDASDRYSVLHNFSTTDGRGPLAPLVEGSDSNFYGTTGDGGQNGLGTIFRISSTGDFKVLYNFDGTIGKGPVGPLIQASDGNFYGATVRGGTLNQGVAFKMTPAGTVTLLYDFSLTAQDGNEPGGGLVQATDGNFYGTLTFGGAAGFGVIYRLTPTGVFTKLHDFYSQTGAYPQCTLLQHTTGKLYGTTTAGGTNNEGVMFEYDPGLGPFVTFLNVYGQVGAKVDILGEYFAAGVTTVFFNGVPALNPKITPTYIEATVPEGATTGLITVTTSKGTLTSNQPFVVH
ncbi:MAG: choice-of-anchor tandem repeat GloVer-containing protein [Terracidiphilus sp.]